MISNAYIEITNACNLSCLTCYNNSGKSKEIKELSVNEIEYIIDTLKGYGCSRFIFAGGEPLCHSNFDKILDIIYKYPQYNFDISTNGTVHNPNIINAYNQLDNLNIQVSLDGSNEEVNRFIRGTGNFAPAMSFVQALHNAKKEIRLKMVINKYNLNDIEKFYDTAISNGAMPEFAFVNKLGSAVVGWNKLGVSTDEKFAVLKLINQLNKKFDKKAFLPSCVTTCPLTNNVLSLSAVITCNGEIMPCQLLYDKSFVLGNIFQFEEALLMDNICKILAFAAKRKLTDYNCDRCIIRSGCGKGCMADAYMKTGDVLGFDNECELRRYQLIQFDLKSRLGLDEKV